MLDTMQQRVTFQHVTQTDSARENGSADLRWPWGRCLIAIAILAIAGWGAIGLAIYTLFGFPG